MSDARREPSLKPPNAARSDWVPKRFKDRTQIVTGPVKRKGLSRVESNNYIIGDGVERLTVGTTPPSGATPGDLWVDTGDGA